MEPRRALHKPHAVKDLATVSTASLNALRAGWPQIRGVMSHKAFHIEDLRRIAADTRRELGLLLFLCSLAAIMLAWDTASLVPIGWLAVMVPVLVGYARLRTAIARKPAAHAADGQVLIAAGLLNATLFALMPVWAVAVAGPTLQIAACMMLAAAAVRVVEDFSISPRVGLASLVPLGLIPGAALVWQQLSQPDPDLVHVATSLTAVVAFLGYVWQFWTVRHRAERQVASTIADLTAVREELEESQCRIDQAVASFGTIVWALDADHRIASFSPGCERLFGRLPVWDDFRGDRRCSLVHPDDWDTVTAAFDRMRRDPSPVTIEHRLQRPDGTIRWVRSTGSRRVRPGAVHGAYIMMTIDITAQRTRDSELAALMDRATAALASRRQLLLEIAPDLAEPLSAGRPDDADTLFQRLESILAEIDARDLTLAVAVKELRDARAAAEEASTAKSQFLANMSHELRTPLNAIIGYSEILMEDLAEDGQDDRIGDARKVRDSARRLLALINEILDLSRMEAGTLEAEPQLLSVGPLISTAVATETARAGALDLDVRVQPGLDRVLLQADRRLLGQCLAHLIGNAVKFTSRGGTVSIAAGPDPAAPGFIDITITDTGPGIAAGQLDGLFDAFTQADTSTTRRHGGTGLGLAVTRRLARLMGGDVAVRSEPGRGSTFTLRLPAGSEDVAVIEGPAGGTRTVLVVEDDPVAAAFTARAATLLGLRVAHAPSGRSALAHAQANPPDLIILDIELPDMCGLDVLGSLQDMDRLRDVPVVVVSVSDRRRASILAGARDHIVKPCGTAELAAAIVRLLPSREGMGDLIEATGPDPEGPDAAAPAPAVRPQDQQATHPAEQAA